MVRLRVAFFAGAGVSAARRGVCAGLLGAGGRRLLGGALAGPLRRGRGVSSGSSGGGRGLCLAGHVVGRGEGAGRPGGPASGAAAARRSGAAVSGGVAGGGAVGGLGVEHPGGLPSRSRAPAGGCGPLRVRSGSVRRRTGAVGVRAVRGTASSGSLRVRPAPRAPRVSPAVRGGVSRRLRPGPVPVGRTPCRPPRRAVPAPAGRPRGPRAAPGRRSQRVRRGRRRVGQPV